jgi:hypothetical protein
MVIKMGRQITGKSGVGSEKSGAKSLASGRPEPDAKF